MCSRAGLASDNPSWQSITSNNAILMILGNNFLFLPDLPFVFPRHNLTWDSYHPPPSRLVILVITSKSCQHRRSFKTSFLSHMTQHLNFDRQDRDGDNRTDGSMLYRHGCHGWCLGSCHCCHLLSHDGSRLELNMNADTIGFYPVY